MYKILIVEDVEPVADLQVLKLIRAGVAVETRRVETPQDFTRQLELYAPDAILCSVSVPRFSGVTALAMAQSLCPDTPLIFVFKTAEEEATVETFTRGAGDHVFKTSPSNLPWTFARAVKQAEERKIADGQGLAMARMTRMYADQVRELDQLSHQHLVFRKLSRYLKAALTPAEVYAAAECFGPQLFQSTNGKLYLVHPPGKHLEGVASWGDRSPSEQAFTVQDCWALRQTQAHWVGDPRTELLCGHVTSDSKSVPPYLCVPIFAQGETLGLLHLRRVKEESTSPENADSIEPYLNLATAVAEETGLALANLSNRSVIRSPVCTTAAFWKNSSCGSWRARTARSTLSP